MKYLLIILVIGLVFFMLGFKRSRPGVKPPAPPPAPPAPPPAPPAPPAVPQHIVSCAHCGLHLPQSEALPGLGGVFCSAAHRAAHEAGKTP